MTGLLAYVSLKVQIELNLISSLFFIVVNVGPKIHLKFSIV